MQGRPCNILPGVLCQCSLLRPLEEARSGRMTWRGVGRGALAVAVVLLGGCISSRQTLTPEAAEVRYINGTDEPDCTMLAEVSVGHDWFVFDERQPAKSHDDVVVRMRRLAAKANGNLVVILENKPPGGKCSGFNGHGRIYRCSSEQLAALDTLPGSEASEAKAADVEK